VRQLGSHGAPTVFDVGANTGQFAQKLRDGGFRGRIVSFEASSAAHANLKKNATRDADWIVAPQMALGDRNGTVSLNIAGNSASSSVLPMLPSHVVADPKSRYTGSEMVELRTLDNVAKEFVSGANGVFLKLDVQGMEYQVLQGASQFIDNVVGIQAELSLVPLYEGERLFDDMFHELETRGFDLWSLVPGFINPDTGRLLQLDAIFFRKQARYPSLEAKSDLVAVQY